MFKVDPEDGDRMFSETSISMLKTVRSHNIEHYAVNNICRCENMEHLPLLHLISLVWGFARFFCGSSSSSSSSSSSKNSEGFYEGPWLY
jgi:hypothetical protein